MIIIDERTLNRHNTHLSGWKELVDYYVDLFSSRQVSEIIGASLTDNTICVASYKLPNSLLNTGYTDQRVYIKVINILDIYNSFNNTAESLEVLYSIRDTIMNASIIKTIKDPTNYALFTNRIVLSTNRTIILQGIYSELTSQVKFNIITNVQYLSTSNDLEVLKYKSTIIDSSLNKAIKKDKLSIKSFYSSLKEDLNLLQILYSTIKFKSSPLYTLLLCSKIKVIDSLSIAFDHYDDITNSRYMGIGNLFDLFEHLGVSKAVSTVLSLDSDLREPIKIVKRVETDTNYVAVYNLKLEIDNKSKGVLLMNSNSSDINLIYDSRGISAA